MRQAKDLAVAFSIYSLGLGSILLADIYVSAHFAKPTIAEWAFYRSSIFILGGICLLGYDQILVREPKLIPRLSRSFAPQAVVLGALGSAFVAAKYGLDVQGFAKLTVIVVAFASATFLAGAARANNRLWQAQLATNFWKTILLAIVVLFPWLGVSAWFLFALAAGLALALLARGYLPAADLPALRADLTIRSARYLGLAFFLHNMTLVTATYGEQFIINLTGNVDVSSRLFRYYAVFTPVALSINGFIGFFLGPKIRRRLRFNLLDLRSLFLHMSLVALIVTLASVLAGAALYRFLHRGEALDVVIIASLAILCITRGIYTVPSVCNGIFASHGVLMRIAMAQWLLVGLYCSSIWLILTSNTTVDASRLIAMTSMAHWVARTIVAGGYSYSTVRASQPN